MIRRKVIYVSGTRADFGLLCSTLCMARDDSRLDISVCATGMHLSPKYGNTITEIEAAGLPIVARIPLDLTPGDGGMMALALAKALDGITKVLQVSKPHIVLVLGDRGEMLAGALAALHLNLIVAHIHGGERSGTVDEPIRHAISKLAHYHFVATSGAKNRLERMGERADHIFVTGAPGLDSLTLAREQTREQLCAGVGFESLRKTALMVFHPVVQEADAAAAQANAIIEAVLAEGMQILCLLPNSDAGAEEIRGAYSKYTEHPDVRLITHLPRQHYLDWMAACDLMVGNSSSGIIEAASLNCMVVNVGNRQREREQSGNVVNCAPDVESIVGATRQALAMRGRSFTNVYGDGRAGERIIQLLSTLPLDPSVLVKINTY